MLNWIARLAFAALGMLLGVLIGAWLERLGAQVAGSNRDLWLVLGGLCGVVLTSVFERLRAHRIVKWLRNPDRGPAPRDAGLFGEMAYRIERALRERDTVLAQEQERLRQFLQAIEASPNGVLLLDAQDRIEWCNAQAADHFGLDPNRDRLQKATNLIRSPAFVSYLQGGDFGEPTLVPDLRRRGTISVWLRPYGDGLKLLLSQDTTERDRSDAMRRDFVANVSHEIRTPLTVVAGFIETLRTLPLDDAERRRVLALMEQQTARMQALVADLLQLAQLEGSPRPPLDRWVPVAPLLARVEAEARALSGGAHQMIFDTDAPYELAGVEAELHSAISNLLSNAVRYTPKGGCIELRWHARADGAGELRVADSGQGIAREHLGRLTERFYRVDNSRSRAFGGTGLGLAIVKHVMQRHGGEVRIESEPGVGSTFALIWPAMRLRARRDLDVSVER